MQYIQHLIQDLESPTEIINVARQRGIKPSRLLPGASYWGHAELVRALLDMGIDPMTCSKSGIPAPALALQWGDISTCKEFERHLPAGTIIDTALESYVPRPYKGKNIITLTGAFKVLLHRVALQHGIAM